MRDERSNAAGRRVCGISRPALGVQVAREARDRGPGPM